LLLEAAGDREEQTLDPPRGEHRNTWVKVVLQTVVERQQAQVPSGPVAAGEQCNRRIQRGHLEPPRQLLDLPAELVDRQSMDPRKPRPPRVADVVIHHGVEAGIGQRGML